MDKREPTLDELLNEPMIRKVMAADGYSAEDIRLLMRHAHARADAGGYRQPRPVTGSRIARLGYARISQMKLYQPSIVIPFWLIAGKTVMPKIDIASVPERKGSGYPPPFDALCAERVRPRLGDAGGLNDFGVNLMRLSIGQLVEPAPLAFARRRIRLCTPRRTDTDRRWRRDGAARRL